MSRRTEKEAKRRQRQREDDLRWLIGAPQGRRILRKLMEDARHDRPTFSGNSRDAYILGQQKLVSDLVQEVKDAALEDFHRLELEARAENRIEAETQGIDHADDESDLDT